LLHTAKNIASQPQPFTTIEEIPKSQNRHSPSYPLRRRLRMEYHSLSMFHRLAGFVLKVQHPIWLFSEGSSKGVIDEEGF
tara:strand:+ start:366 stop:605 length:240 start_codon:yes stop_codon:yes gene_type:complete